MILCSSLCPNTVLAKWHHHSHGSHIPPFLVKELWLLCWWVIHITERDAQIPETSYYCCIKCWEAERAREDGLWWTSTVELQEMRAQLKGFQLVPTTDVFKNRIMDQCLLSHSWQVANYLVNLLCLYFNFEGEKMTHLLCFSLQTGR